MNELADVTLEQVASALDLYEAVQALRLKPHPDPNTWLVRGLELARLCAATERMQETWKLEGEE